MRGTFFLLTAGLTVSLVLSEDVTTENPTPGPCEDVQLITCFLPFVAFVFSDEVKDYTPARAKGQITEPQLDRLCGLGNDTATCFNDYTQRCVAKNYTDVHITTQGTLKFLNFCNEPGIFPKVQKLFSCGQTMEPVHRRCGESMSSVVPADVDTSNPTAILQRPNALRDLCCHAKKYERCYLPEVQAQCGADGLAVNQDFLNRIYNSYQCATHLSACPV